ncbi:hypothetical protein, partial [uncultured Thalassospira sp.]|uniref:hypothetical protein n=1 Tax=uncultured Thalassospira sp. TaxID=404382 RepID=UPI0030D79292
LGKGEVESSNLSGSTIFQISTKSTLNILAFHCGHKIGAPAPAAGQFFPIPLPRAEKPPPPFVYRRCHNGRMLR